MKNWKVYLITALAVIFVGCNLFLLLKEDSKAERTTYLDDWSKVKSDDVEEIFTTKGVVKPEEKNDIYYDEKRGSVAAFLVKKGDRISRGTALFTYGSDALENQKSEKEAEITQINDEIKSIDSQIAELQKMTPKTPSVPEIPSSDDKDTKVQVNVDVSPIVEGDVEKEIIAAQSEKDKLSAKLAKSQADLNRITDQLSKVSINSEVEGQVIAVNKNMKNPIITIASSAVGAEGELNEKQIGKAEVGQKVRLYSELDKKTYEGSIKEIVHYPKNEVKVDKQSKYPFTIALDKKNDTLLPGSKVKLTITVGEAKAVPVVAHSSTFKEKKKTKVYQITGKGTIEEKNIEPGLRFAGKQEVKSGLKAGDYLVANPSDLKQNGTSFITPITTSKVDWKAWKDLSKKQVLKYASMGIFEK
ncbi:efflux RND transporter periplasmic adaptor subunit [Bacillus testis]|uniref:efflux RND transporter periplasmic adaptor subunit n=1 Tax=Bacillus testis TaxID=1622072 RepID=UPI00067EE3ED|nr:efflux RND transporter periplasmic adaptor subunit [Bacillus testis]